MCRRGQLYLVDSRQSHKADLISASVTHTRKARNVSHVARIAGSNVSRSAAQQHTHESSSQRTRSSRPCTCSPSMTCTKYYRRW